AFAFTPVKQRDAAQGGWTRTRNQPRLEPEVIHRLPFHRKDSDLKERLVHGRFIDRAERIDSSVAKVPVNSALRRGSEVVLGTAIQCPGRHAGDGVLSAYGYQ